MSTRLNNARAQFAAAKAEFNAAMSAEGFSPTRADKAQSRLDAANAELENAIVNESGERDREQALIQLERRMQRLQRDLRYSSMKLRQAMMSAGMNFFLGISVETIETRVKDAFDSIDQTLKFKGLSPTKRQNLEDLKARLGEVSYRLGFVREQSEQLDRVKLSITEINNSRAAA